MLSRLTNFQSEDEVQELVPLKDDLEWIQLSRKMVKLCSNEDEAISKTGSSAGGDLYYYTSISHRENVSQLYNATVAPEVREESHLAEVILFGTFKIGRRGRDEDYISCDMNDLVLKSTGLIDLNHPELARLTSMLLLKRYTPAKDDDDTVTEVDSDAPATDLEKESEEVSPPQQQLVKAKPARIALKDRLAKTIPMISPSKCSPALVQEV